MHSSTARRFVTFGAIAQIALPFGLGLAAFRLANVQVVASSAAVPPGIPGAIAAISAGLVVAGLGVISAVIGIGPGGYRAAWVLHFGRIAAVLWLLYFPLGAVVGIPALMFFVYRKEEFRPVTLPPDGATSA